MPIVQQNSRIAHHRLTSSGSTFTIPPSEDFTDGTWAMTDLCIGEIGMNTADDRLFFRTVNGIVEIATADGLAGLWYRDSDDNIVADYIASPLIYPNILAPADNVSDLGLSSVQWKNLWVNTVESNNNSGANPLILQCVEGSPLSATSRITLASSDAKIETYILGSGGHFNFLELTSIDERLKTVAAYTGSEEVRLQRGITTTTSSIPGTPTAILTLTMDDGEAINVFVRIIGRSPAGTEICAVTMSGAFYKESGTLTQLGATDYITNSSLTGTSTATLDIDASNYLQVTVDPEPDPALLPLDIHWMCWVTYNKILTDS